MSPNAKGGGGGFGGGGCGVSANESGCAHGAQINFGDITPYLLLNLWFRRNKNKEEVPLFYVDRIGSTLYIHAS